ncbi:hypothetical protein [Persicitalea sp.]|uniref:hypothetical protein n=1 Tax=Persicitalea sp. TaxID=3100273 RepID=UPI0035931EBA
MNLRSFIVLLVLANYLFLAGSGYVSRPEQDSFMVLIQSKSAESHHYESRRYMRTDALESFIVEALATKYENATHAQDQLLFLIVTGVDAHPLPDIDQFQVASVFKKKNNRYHYTIMPIRNIALAIFSPPESSGLA